MHLFSQNDENIFKKIEKIREDIKSQNLSIELNDYGAGSPKEKRSEDEMYDGVKKRTNTFDLCSIGLKNEWAQELYLLVKENKPKNILELGTCCGFSSIYMSKANESSNIFTIEGDCNVAEIARQNMLKAECSNIIQHIGRFQDILDDVLKEVEDVDFAFIDGHHDKEATIKYYYQIKPYLSSHAIVVFDDISWSTGMEEAWNEIKQDTDIEKFKDLKKLGICYMK